MTEKYLGTLRTPGEVHEFVEKRPHTRCWPEMAKGAREGIDPPRAMYLGGAGLRVRIPAEVWKMCKLKPGDEFDRRMFRYESGTSEQQTSQEPVAPGRRYRHLKRGTTYTVLGDATLQISTFPPDEGDTLRVYRSDEDGKLWVRSATEFLDGRFEEIE